jgi:hypothetical protein
VSTDIRALFQAFLDAELHADTAALHTLLAGDFLSVGEQGYQLDKPQWIARHHEFSYEAIDVEDLDLRLYDHTAIFGYVQHSRATWQGQSMTLTTRAVQVWVEQSDAWRLVSIQFSSLNQS